MFTVLLIHQQEGIHADPRQSLMVAATSVCWPLGILRSIRTAILVTVPPVSSCFMIIEPAIQQVPVGFVDWLLGSIVYLHSLFPWWRFCLCVPLLSPSLVSIVVGFWVKCNAFLPFSEQLYKVVHSRTSVLKCDRVSHSTNYLNQLYYLCHHGFSNFQTTFRNTKPSLYTFSLLKQ